MRNDKTSQSGRSSEHSIKVSTSAPQGFLDMIWSEFYRSRNRGISLQRHLPWLDRKQSWFVTLVDNDEVVAGLAVNPVESRCGLYVAGLIGLVCVQVSHRGRGYSSILLNATINEAKEKNIDDLLLWTNKPGVYEKLGFTCCDSAYFGWATAAQKSDRQNQDDLARTVWPNSDSPRGIPAFAHTAHEWSSTTASIIVLSDNSGDILAEWSGSDENVARIVDNIMPSRWRMNSLVGDTLADSLADHRWLLSLQPASLQMMLNLNRRDGPVDPYQLRVLDRI